MTTVSLDAPRASSTTSDLLAVTGRVLLAAIFVLSGVSKLADPAGTIAYISSAGLPAPSVAYGIAVIVELVGGLLLIAGFRTRIVASAIALFSLAAAVGFHANLADQNQFIHFFKNVALAGGLLQVAAFGSGRFGFDRR
ncbi:DoxX family protein [Novosphingobium taihuense]|uniref:Putative oxidoreductase n=1 Tax=Novosphingobium taihuense TaxID=260085 RepID=A0A7W7AAX2_9SPHN|nr:DoxX family protein [Novosphingobium taihuense]MBB4613506.1 putative oxidoreductase [Novosphingobium taihuense]TWH79985.1 putative oxidoreductase [Novosphingobium taihuense]